MMLLALAAALPVLFWDGAPESAPLLRESGVTRIAAPAARLAAWKGVAEIAVEAADLEHVVKLQTPAVNNRANQAGATGEPWIVANGWLLMRKPDGRYYYD